MWDLFVVNSEAEIFKLGYEAETVDAVGYVAHPVVA